MEHVISPWMIYFTSMVNGSATFGIVCVFLVVALLGYVGVSIGYRVSLDNDNFLDGTSNTLMAVKRCLRVPAILGILAALLCIAVPSEKTLVKMAVASYITTDRVENVEAKAGEVYNKLNRLIDALIDKSKKTDNPPHKD